ncbi:MAG: dihydropteroate synthase [Dehalococcoidia bacterium]|nr:dihydropteroate synthase [Dehalococcoidia bacterium]
MSANSPRSSSWPFAWGERTYVAGIINTSPDSFSGDGLAETDAAVEYGLCLVDEGADLLDVGGVSTRPGAPLVPENEERRRVLPVLAALAAKTNVPLSVDTSRAAVAREALGAGATIVNDVWALTADPELAAVVATAQAGVVLMHNRQARATRHAIVGGHYSDVPDANVFDSVVSFLRERGAAAQAAGIARSQVVLDPGLGFGKTPAQTMLLLRRTADLKRELALPLLVGPSRKSFIGRALDLPVAERLEGTIAAVVLAVAGGADIVRVHDVQACARAVRMTDAVVRGMPDAEARQPTDRLGSPHP